MWETVKLGDVADVKAGNSAPQDKSLYEAGQYPFVRTSDVGSIKIGRLSSTRDLLNEIGIQKLKLFPRGTILFPKSGASTFLNHRVILNIDAYVASHLATIKASDGHLLDNYAWYFLQTIDASDLVADSAYPSLQAETIKEIPIPLPPLAEQQRIVAKLDAAFAEIDTLVTTTSEQKDGASLIHNSWLKKQFSQLKLGNNEHLSMCVGVPKITAKNGWTWHKLTDIAKMESGHTPSRRHPEYWGGTVKWVGIKDARKHHGAVIYETMQHTNELGIKNSSARLLPKNTVCLSRTASVGYVFRLGASMATSQDFINWVCTPTIKPEFLHLILLAEGENIKRFGSGAVHKTIYFDTAKEFYVCVPTVKIQEQIINAYRPVVQISEKIMSSKADKLELLNTLKSSILAQELRSEVA